MLVHLENFEELILRYLTAQVRVELADETTKLEGAKIDVQFLEQALELLPTDCARVILVELSKKLPEILCARTGGFETLRELRAKGTRVRARGCE